MAKIDKGMLYNNLSRFGDNVMKRINSYDENSDSYDTLDKLLFMRELNTISLIKYIVADFPEVE